MVVALLQRLLVAAAFVALGAAGAARAGVPAALAVVAGVAAAVSVLGALLLRTSALGEVTWRNVVAGWLLGWGFTFGGGSLPKITLHSAACLALMGIIGAVTGPARLLAAAWTLDAVALLMLFRAYGAQTGNSSARRQLLKPIVAVLGLAVAGGVLALDGRPETAALVAGGPLVAVGVLYGAWLLVLVTAGRKGRWN